MPNENLIKKIDQENSITTPFNDLETLENSVTNGLHTLGLPTKDIFLGINERTLLFKNIDYLLDKIGDKKSEAIYMSKIIASIIVGIPEAPLNYLWNSTFWHSIK